MTPGDAAVSVCMSAGKVIAEQADRITALEAKVRELEATALLFRDQRNAEEKKVRELERLNSPACAALCAGPVE